MNAHDEMLHYLLKVEILMSFNEGENMTFWESTESRNFNEF